VSFSLLNITHFRRQTTALTVVNFLGVESFYIFHPKVSSSFRGIPCSYRRGSYDRFAAV